MGRPKGSRNKASRELLWKLEKEHNFNVVAKIIKLYSEIEEVYQDLLLKCMKNIEAGKLVTSGLLPEEVDMLNNSQKNLWNILSKLVAYCYPKLKALELDPGDSDQIVFNISIPPKITEE